MSQSYAKERQGIGESEAIEPSAYFRELCGHVENHRDEDSRERGTVRRYDSLIVNLTCIHRPRCGASGDERNLNLVAQGVGQVEVSETLSLKPWGSRRERNLKSCELVGYKILGGTHVSRMRYKRGQYPSRI